jgi:hypothetical protein
MWGSTEFKLEFLTNLMKALTYNTNHGCTVSPGEYTPLHPSPVTIIIKPLPLAFRT